MELFISYIYREENRTVRWEYSTPTLHAKNSETEKT